jgi:ketosteroid isomerase-like protein
MIMARMAIHDIAEAIGRGVAARDLGIVRSLFAPGATVWHAIGDATMTLQDSLRGLQAVLDVTSELSYVEVRVTPTAQGYLDQHYVQAVMKSGQHIRFPAVMVVTMNDGLITRLEEYIEASAAAPIFEALSDTR